MEPGEAWMIQFWSAHTYLPSTLPSNERAEHTDTYRPTNIKVLPDLGLLVSLSQHYRSAFWAIIIFQIDEPREYCHFEKVTVPPFLLEDSADSQPPILKPKSHYPYFWLFMTSSWAALPPHFTATQPAGGGRDQRQKVSSTGERSKRLPIHLLLTLRHTTPWFLQTGYCPHSELGEKGKNSQNFCTCGWRNQAAYQEFQFKGAGVGMKKKKREKIGREKRERRNKKEVDEAGKGKWPGLEFPKPAPLAHFHLQKDEEKQKGRPRPLSGTLIA